MIKKKRIWYFSLDLKHPNNDVATILRSKQEIQIAYRMSDREKILRCFVNFLIMFSAVNINSHMRMNINYC